LSGAVPFRPGFVANQFRRITAMRLVLLCLFLFAALPAWAGAPNSPPASAANVLRLHPRPWQFPALLARAGVRFEPETGEAPAEFATVGARQTSDASLRARAEASVRTLPDGSRHVVLNGALRSWTVATIDDQGRLVQDCVHSEADARRQVEAAAAAPAREHK
jgi:hypothetical protein